MRIAWLVGLCGIFLASPAAALLQTAASIDGGPVFRACDNVAAGGACGSGLATFSDINPAVGRLDTLGATFGDITVGFASQTADKGALNSLSSSGTQIENSGTVPHTIVFTISDIGFLGPALTITATGSGTWVDPVNVDAAFGPSAITMAWWNDPANTQGANTPGDTPGQLAFGPSLFDPVDGTNLQSFAFNSGANQPLGIPDPGLFSMTLDNTLVLGPGIRLESRGQVESKPQVVPAPLSLLLVGLGLLGLVGMRQRLAMLVVVLAGLGGFVGSATAQTTWQATLQWTDNAPDETGRRVERQDGATTAPWVSQGDLGPNVTVFQQGGLPPNMAYCYRTVVLRNAESTVSTPACGTTGGATVPPAADTGFILTYTPGTAAPPALQFRQHPSGMPIPAPPPGPRRPMPPPQPRPAQPR